MRSALILAIALALPPLGALAQSEQKLVKRYTDLAGSQQNAEALVTGLRQKMGFGNVDNALALTQASLQKQGITDPTPEQLKIALAGVLEQRADGRGWGEIAHSMGFKLGELKGGQHRPERMERVQHARMERPERPEKPERPQRPDKPERPGRH